jgi:hypothetical protein
MLQRVVDPAAVEAEIERVRAPSGHAAAAALAVFGRSRPEYLMADLLRRMIANRIQEKASAPSTAPSANFWTALPGATVREKPSATSVS